MNVNSTLESSLLGVQKAQQGLLLTAQNVTNANRPGYARRSVSSTLAEGMNASGAAATANNGAQFLTIRSSDALLLGQMFKLTGSQEYAQTLVQTTSTLNAMLGKADQSMAQALGSFFNAAGALANDVSSPVLQNSLVASGQQVVDRLANFDALIGTMRQQAQQGVADNLNQANTALRQLAQLNEAIAQGSTNGNATSVPDLLDQRDALILDLQKRIGGEVSILTDGTANYRLSGVQMVQGSSANQFSQSGGGTRISSEAALSDILILVPSGAASTNPLIRTQTRDASGQPVNLLQSGAAGAYVELLQQFIPSVQARINLIGASVAMQTNAVQRADGTAIAPVFGYAPASASGQATTSVAEIAQRAGYKDLPGVETASFRQMLDALDPASASYSVDLVNKLNGSGVQASQLRLVMSGTVASVGTIDAQAAGAIESTRTSLSSPLAGINSQWANQLADWSKDQTLQSALLQAVNDQYQSVAGVNLDEEALNMQTYQRQYTAASKLMQTLNRMLDDLLSMVAQG